MPKNVIILKGTTEKEVMPSTANEIIFQKLYFDTPAALLSRSYDMVVELKPSDGNIPLRKRLVSRYSFNTFNTLLLTNLKSA